MKYKYMAIMLGIVIISASLAGCSGSGTGEKEAGQESIIGENSEERTDGEVTGVEDGKITIAVGARKEAADGETLTEDMGEHPSMLELTGEEMEIAVTDNTVITRQGMGGKEAPDGEKPQGKAPEDGAPEKPENDGEREEVPEDAPEGGREITLEDIAVGDTVSVTFDEDGNAAEISVMSAGMGGGDMGESSKVEEYDAVKEYTEDAQADGEAFESTGKDENAIHVAGDALVNLKNIEVKRRSDDSTGGDTSSFYGVGAAVLGTAGKTYIGNSVISTDAPGGAGIFAYGDGTVYAADSAITTKQDASGGIHVAGGGKLYAWNLNVRTEGESAAAIRSDRGGGTMVVDGGNYTSGGKGSPAVYCTANIAIKDSTLTANGSEAVCIEGANELYLYNSNVIGNMRDDGRNDCTWNVILYQSMSGDAEAGNSNFQMNGGTLTGKNGGMFYTTNTESTITLSGVDITYADDSDFFLRCTGNSNERGWGQAGKNGAGCLFTANAQSMEGDIIWDSISKLDFYMTEGSALKGAFIQDDSYAGEGGDGYADVWIDENSTWTVTGDSTLSNLHNAGKIIDSGGNPVTVIGSDGTVYAEGTSEYTVTVDAYEAAADVSGADTLSDWAEYSVEKPENLA